MTQKRQAIVGALFHSIILPAGIVRSCNLFFIPILFFLTLNLLPYRSEVKLIPRRALFGNPVKAAPQLSPDGKRLGYIAPVSGVSNVWIKTIGKNDDKPITRDLNRGVTNFIWAHESRFVLYFQDKNGDENNHLYRIDLAAEKITDLTPFENIQVRFAAGHKDFPNDIFITMNRDDAKIHDLYRLNIESGQIRLVYKNPGSIISWLFDTHFNIRGAVISTVDGYAVVVEREKGSGWQVLLTIEGPDALTTGPLSYSEDGEWLYFKNSKESNTTRITRINVRTGAEEVIYENPDYDVSNVLISPVTNNVQMVGFVSDRTVNKIIDPQIKEDVEYIERLNPGDFFIASRDILDQQWVVGFTRDDRPTAYYLYDRKTKKSQFLFEDKPFFNKFSLAPMEAITFTSRDGLKIHGYITFPPGASRRHLPMVLSVHGGPWLRDGWGFNPRAQWFANRGYICLQINFRGSTGYGKAFSNAGDKEWGGKMQNDMTDGVSWAIKKGYADPKRIAIFGGSYGGYASLVGVTFTPDLYRCAVAAMGPSNLITFLKSAPPYWSNLMGGIYKRIGDPRTETEFLKSRSPLFKVDAIKAPVLILQGANDPRVKRFESEQIVQAIHSKGIECEYLLFEDEGHTLVKSQNIEKFYSHSEKFLAKHLGGRLES